VRLDLDSAIADAVYALAGGYTSCHPPVPTGEVAAATNVLGHGRSLTFGFDLIAAPSFQSGMALQQAVTFVTPTALSLAPLDVAGVEIDLKNHGPALSLQVNEALPLGLDAFLAIPDTWINPSGTLIEWNATLPPQGADTLRYLARLPDRSGTFTTTTTVLLLGTGGPQTYKTVSLDLNVGVTPAALLASAQSVAAQLPSHGPDSNVRKAIQTRLASVQARVVSRRSDAEANIDDLLDAVESAEKLKTVDPTPMRLALDELIRYWEARWYAF